MSEKLVVSSADVDLKAQVEKELLDRLGKESIGEPPKLEHSSPDSDHDETRRMELFDTFSDPNNLSLAFSTAHVSVFNKDNAIILDINQFISYYHEITSVSNNIVIITALSSMFDELKRDIKQLTAEKFVSLVVPLYVPFLEEPEISRILTSKICDIVGILDGSQRFEFAFVLQESIQFSSKNATDKSKLFKQVVQIFQKHLSSLVSNNQHEDLEACEDISNVVQALGIFSAINDTNTFLPHFEFYNQALEEWLDLKDEYPKWKSGDSFSFLNYPFLLSTVIKGDILRIESMIQMRHELQDSFFRAMFIGVNSPYLQSEFDSNLVEVRRESVIRDALYQIESKPNGDLRKQLRVTFSGEDGIDEGGIQKEFFQIITKEMFSAPVGLYTTNEESRTSWFSYWEGDQQKDMADEYRLLGKLMGLAFYNGIHLNINFTPAVYKRLLKNQITLRDLKEYDPALGSGFEKLLQYEGDVEEDYQRNFTIDLKTPIGKVVTKDLVENGSNIPVTNDNRVEFVERYIDYFFCKSVEPAFSAFKEGFDSVMEFSSIKLFKAEELQELICGSPVLDFKELESTTVYDGYEKDSLVIKYFWEIVHEMSDEEKKQLLVFTTGSDRVPIGGLSKLQFVITRNGTDGTRLPSSHTCFNALLLCEYESKAQLKEKLKTALEYRNCGFYLN